jgi:hypothetical protein
MTLDVVRQMKKLLIVSTLAVGAGLTAGAGRADASLIVTHTGIITALGISTYSYDLHLGPGEKLDTTVGSQFVVVYDFFGLITQNPFLNSAATTAAGGVFTAPIVPPKSGPIANKQAPADDATVPNLLYTYSGGVISNPSGSPDLLLGSFSATSTQSLTTLDDFSGQATLISSGGLFGNTGTTTVPGIIPEPGSMVLLGTGLLGLASLARRRAARKAR